MQRFFKPRIRLIAGIGLVLLGIGSAQAAEVSDGSATVRFGVGTAWLGAKSSGPFARTDAIGQDWLMFEVLNQPASAKTVAPSAASVIGGDLLEVGKVSKPSIDPLPSDGENPEVFPVPLPTAVWSFLVGLMGVLGFKKRKRTSTKVH
jgi:hypothetical protein